MYTISMLCPNCKSELKQKKLKKVEVDHCNTCGGTLFDFYEINRISLKDARELAKIKETDTISGEEKFSPRDGSPLKRVSDDSIPQHVTLLKSDTTNEIFAFPDDLVNLKKAQKAKLNYFKAWSIPVPAVRSIFVFSLIIVSSLSLVYFANKLQAPTTQTIQASNICKNNIDIITTDSQYVVSCITKSNFTSQAKIVCRGKERTIDVNKTPSQAHIFTIPLTCESIQFVFNDNGSIIMTEWIGF